MKLVKIAVGFCLAVLVFSSVAQTAEASENLDLTISNCFIEVTDDWYYIVFDDDPSGISIVNNGKELLAADDPRSW